MHFLLIHVLICRLLVTLLCSFVQSRRLLLFYVVVMRPDPVLVLFFFFLMIRRPPRSTLDRSSAASDVYKRQVVVHQNVGVDRQAMGTDHVLEDFKIAVPVGFVAKDGLPVVATLDDVMRETRHDQARKSCHPRSRITSRPHMAPVSRR